MEYVRPLNERQILELGQFEVGNLAKNWHFFDYNDFFLQLGGARATFNGLNQGCDLKLFLVTNQMSKIEKSEFFLLKSSFV